MVFNRVKEERLKKPSKCGILMDDTGFRQVDYISCPSAMLIQPRLLSHHLDNFDDGASRCGRRTSRHPIGRTAALEAAIATGMGSAAGRRGAPAAEERGQQPALCRPAAISRRREDAAANASGWITAAVFHSIRRS